MEHHHKDTYIHTYITPRTVPQRLLAEGELRGESSSPYNMAFRGGVFFMLDFLSSEIEYCCCPFEF